MSPPAPGNEPREPQATTTQLLYDYDTDTLIGPATADQIALSEATVTWGGDGMIHIDAAGRVCAFGYHVTPGPGIRRVFAQPIITPAGSAAMTASAANAARPGRQAPPTANGAATDAARPCGAEVTA